MLGFMFRHYDDLVRRYIVYDDGSTDDTLQILRSHPKVEIRSVSFTADSTSLLRSGMGLIEECWKESHDDADWVIVTEIDEHLYHPNLGAYLDRCKTVGVTLIPALGYQMLSDTFPPRDALLCEYLTQGAPWVQMNKVNVFSPRDISSINYSLGRHVAKPVGRVVFPDRDELLLLHYKYLDFENTQRRHEQYGARLRELDVTNNWGHRWRWSREELRRDWDQFATRLVDVSTLYPNACRSHGTSRWWRDPERI